MADQSAQIGCPEDESRPFWDGAARGVLMLKRCIDTGTAFYYPREHSPFTGGPTEWIEASGEGEVYSCSLSHRAKPPYCIAYVRLAEGPLMLTNVVADDLASIAIGDAVRVFFQPDDKGRPTPFFRKA